MQSSCRRQEPSRRVATCSNFGMACWRPFAEKQRHGTMSLLIKNGRIVTADSDFSGDIFQRFDFYWDRSPLKYASNVKTPTLILHSDNDFRVPIEQGEQWFRALKHFGVTTEIVMFPRENHNLTRTGEPKHLVESLNWQLYWFDRFLNGNDKAVPPDAK